jgi:CobN/Magnesium Chelatase
MQVLCWSTASSWATSGSECSLPWAWRATQCACCSSGTLRRARLECLPAKQLRRLLHVDPATELLAILCSVAASCAGTRSMLPFTSGLSRTLAQTLCCTLACTALLNGCVFCSCEHHAHAFAARVPASLRSSTDLLRKPVLQVPRTADFGICAMQLPGAPLGNSGLSWSDVLLSSLPNVYVYAANNPSESIIAKRRGYGTIVSHNVPPYGRCDAGSSGVLPSQAAWPMLIDPAATCRAGLYKQLSGLKSMLAEVRDEASAIDSLKEPIAASLEATGVQCTAEGDFTSHCHVGLTGCVALCHQSKRPSTQDPSTYQAQFFPQDWAETARSRRE